MMSGQKTSSDVSELDADLDFRVSPEESEAQERLGPPRMTMDEYFDWLARCPPLTYEQLRALPLTTGERFKLDE